jgi:D-arabinose 1-dehydrogenase-like Zn-dependent alcohol dehydrogenase
MRSATPDVLAIPLLSRASAGLGHLGVQYAKKMGFRTVAIGFGPDKEHLAPKLGAHVYIDAKDEDVGAALQKVGGADVILATAPSGAAIASLLPGLSVRGKARCGWCVG